MLKSGRPVQLSETPFYDARRQSTAFNAIVKIVSNPAGFR